MVSRRQQTEYNESTEMPKLPCSKHNQVLSQGVAEPRAVRASQTPNLIPPEKSDQKTIASYLDYILGIDNWFHPPNERVLGWGIKSARAKKNYLQSLREQGVKKGVMDVITFVTVSIEDPETNIYKDYKGLAFEVKALDGDDPTPDQRMWLRAMKRNGFYTFVAYGADAAIRKIKEAYRK